jgi:hypothetical protein
MACWSSSAVFITNGPENQKIKQYRKRIPYIAVITNGPENQKIKQQMKKLDRILTMTVLLKLLTK